MKTVRATGLVVLILMFAPFAWAQDEKPTMDIPVFPKGEASLEVNLTSEEFLPVLQAMLPMMAGKLGDMADKIDPAAIAEALSDLKRIQVLQVDVTDPKVTDADIAAFYTRSIPAGKWSRILWQAYGGKGTMALYAQDKMESIYGFWISDAKIGEKKGKRVMVAKIDGRIDFAKLMKLAATLLTKS